LLVESAKGIDNLDEIVANDGIDALFFGYADLSHSLGHACDPTNPVVTEHVERAIARVVEANVAVGVSCRSETEAARRLRSGVNFVTYSGLETLALRGCREAVARLRARD
jgi:2-keto-3-deoxy-L-rhamnonate aldolase RhmA